MTIVWQWRIGKNDTGMRLLQFLSKSCKLAPSSKALKRAIEQKCCLVNGTIETFSSYILKEGDLISLDPTAFTTKEEKEISILYEDENLMALNKPSGTLTDLKQLGIKKGFLVHRLDKETSGVLLIAKTQVAKKKLEEMFKEHQIQKIYLAIVDGKCAQGSGIIENFLGKKGEYAGQTIYGSVSKEKGKRALTHFRFLDISSKASLVACEPKTGRTHQIRVHLSGMGHPILGDRQYAKKFLAPFTPKRNLLHAYQLRFAHPITNEPLTLTAPIPSDFQEAMRALHLTLGSKR